MPPRLIIFAIPGFLLLLTVEAVLAAMMRRDLYELKDTGQA